MKINRSIMDTLFEVAASNEYPRAKLAAAVVRNNRVIAIGINRLKTDPFQVKYGKNKDSISLHAEIHAIKNALRKMSPAELGGTLLYVFRVKQTSTNNKTLIPGLAKPCEGCMRAIAEFGFRNVIYSTNQHDVYEVI